MDHESGKSGLDRWLLERLAPADAETALADLHDERTAGVVGSIRYGLQVGSVCAYAVRDSVLAGGLSTWSLAGVQPVHALGLAFRGLRRAPGTSTAAVLTMGVGLTAAVVVLGILHGSMRPLPVPQGEEIVSLDLLDERGRTVALPPIPAAEWATGYGIDAAAGLRTMTATLTRTDAPALRASGAAMEAAVFPLLGLRPALGRWPTAGVDDADALMLGWDAWEQLGGDQALLGSEVRLDGVPHTLVGVMPPDFGFPENQAYWTVLPAGAVPDEVVSRLAEGIGASAAARALENRVAGLPAVEGVDGPYRVRVESWVAGRGEGGEAVAFGALAVLAAFLVIICGTNVSTLLLLRATDRAGTLAVHAALGASRMQVAFQLFAEALIIALAGGVVGLAGGAALLRWAELRLSSHWGYYWMRMEVRPAVVLSALAVVVSAAVVAGTVPALRASKVDLREVLSGNGRGSPGGQQRLGRWFVRFQVTLSTIGMVAALYLGGGIVRTGALHANLPVDEVAVGVVTPGDEYATPAGRDALVAALHRELVRIPGVLSATVSMGIPGFENRFAPLALPGDDVGAESDRTVAFMAAGPGFSETYGLRLLHGRYFSPADDDSAPPVAVVTASYAERFLDGGDPLGTRLRIGGVHGEDSWAEVVGVMADWYPDDPGVNPERVVLPLAQAPPGGLRVSVRTSGQPREALAAMHEAVARIDSDLALERAEPLAALVAWLTRMSRVLAGFGLAGGAAGVMVAAIGLYGVISFQVQQRMPEFGVRMALGASSPRILLAVLRETAVRVAPGILVGLVLAALVAPVLTVFVRGVDPRSVMLHVVAGGTMVGVAVLAVLGPALRAARLQPSTVLRGE